jgi:hypothetical protein
MTSGKLQQHRRRFSCHQDLRETAAVVVAGAAVNPSKAVTGTLAVAIRMTYRVLISATPTRTSLQMEFTPTDRCLVGNIQVFTRRLDR